MNWDWINTAIAASMGAAIAVVGFLFKGSYLPVWWYDRTAFLRFDRELDPLDKQAVMGCFRFERKMPGEGPLIGYKLLEECGAPGEAPISVRLTALGQRYGKYLVKKRANQTEKKLSIEALALLLHFEREPPEVCEMLGEQVSSKSYLQLCNAGMVGEEWMWERPMSFIISRALSQKYFSEHDAPGGFLTRILWRRKMKKLETATEEFEKFLRH